MSSKTIKHEIDEITSRNVCKYLLILLSNQLERKNMQLVEINRIKKTHYYCEYSISCTDLYTKIVKTMFCKLGNWKNLNNTKIVKNCKTTV